MKQQFSLLSVIMSGLFFLTLLYLGAFFFRQLIAPYETVTAQEFLQEDILSLSVIVIREETVIHTIGQHIDFTAESGQTLAKGTPVAIVETRTVTTPVAGIFLQELDGYEHLSPDTLKDLTVWQLDTLLEDPHTSVNSAGKVITGFVWYLAAALHESDAARLQVGTNLQLNTEKPVSASVIHISAPTDGKCAVIFRCTDHLESALYSRELSASILCSKTEGLRIPKAAVLKEEDGRCFVFVISARRAEKKNVTILSETDEDVIVEKDSSAGSLRAGDTIIVSNLDQISEGMLMD